MKNKEQINNKVDAAFNALNAIEEVQVNHFFKHKVLQQLELQNEVKTPIFTWFTPKFQLASLVVVLLLNASAILYAFSSQEKTGTVSLETFAQEYSLQSTTTSILN